MADPRRAQFGFDDLAAWPTWAAFDAESISRLALVAGAWYEAPRLRRCIAAPVLRRLDELLGAPMAAALLAEPAEAPPTSNAAHASPTPAPLPGPGALGDWLVMHGVEVLLAAIESPLVALALRERHWPRTQPPLPGLDRERARAALDRAHRAHRTQHTQRSNGTEAAA